MVNPNGYIQGTDGVPLELVDATARRQLSGKLDAPGDVKAGDYLMVKSVSEDGTVVLGGAEAPGGGSGQNAALTAEERSTLIAVVNAIGAFDTTNGKALIDAFNSAWGYSGGEQEPDEPEEPVKTLVRISAVYIGGEVAVGTALTELVGITVTAHYSDGSTETVSGYTLSGEIAEGSNTITVSYGGKTATFTVTGIDATKVYGVDLTWGGVPEYGEWSADGKWFRVHYSESKASVQVGNGFAVEKIYSKPIDGNAYRYFRVPTNEGSQYSVANNVTFYGCDSPDALTEAGHPVTKCAKQFAFVPCDFAADSDTEGMTILYPTDQYDYYYIAYVTGNSLTAAYPGLLGIFDANILENPLANPTE